MSSKKNKDREEAEDIEPGPPDFTNSITETDHGELQMDRGAVIEKLLGDQLEPRSEPKVLLRLHSGVIRADFALALNVKPYQAPRRSDEPPVPIVLGPFSQAQLQKAAESGLLHAQDCLILGFGRWKTVKELFPDFVDASPKDEITDTMTSPSESGAVYEDDETTQTSSTATHTGSGLELNAVDETGEMTLTPAPTGESEDKPAPSASDKEMLTSLDLESDEEAAKPAAVVAPVTASKKAEAKLPAPASVTVKPAAPRPGNREKVVEPLKAKPAAAPSTTKIIEKKSPTTPQLVAIFAAIMAVGYVVSLKRRAAKTAPAPYSSLSKAPVLSGSYPPNLKPQPIESLYADDSPLVAKIRPILNAYESGTSVLSAADEKTLKEVADPASASFEARRLAANQLAVFYLANSRIDDARAVLKPILEASTSDPITLLNMALLQMGSGEYGEARETATAALRLVTPANSWIACSVVGLIEGYRGRFDEAEIYFKDALRRSPNNPFIYGLFIRTLVDHPDQQDKIPELIQEALWADPDRLMDSPIRAPLAGHILTSLAFEGLSKGAELRASRLSAGKKAFVRWLEGRYRKNPLSQSLTSVSDLLAQEEDPQSQVLYAFILHEQGKLDEASQILNRVMPLLQTQDLKSSWPWSYAGDIQFARRNVSQAIVFYQNALSRNFQDVSAVYGMALAFREGSEFKNAEQKLSEAISLDPSFIPALLRISRFEWHSGYRTQ